MQIIPEKLQSLTTTGEDKVRQLEERVAMLEAELNKTPDTERLERITDYLADSDENAILFDGLNDAIIGVAHKYGENPVVAYSRPAIIATLMKQNDWQEDEAEEWMQFNIECLGLGEATPVIVDPFEW